jgi:hypothetical protein
MNFDLINVLFQTLVIPVPVRHSFPDPWDFGTDPDPRIRSQKLWIRLWIWIRPWIQIRPTYISQVWTRIRNLIRIRIRAKSLRIRIQGANKPTNPADPDPVN